MPVFALLFTESLQNLADGFLPQVAKNAVVASYLPVIVGQAQGIAQRVDLVLALMQVGIHRGVVAGPFAACRSHVKGVGIGVDADTLQLAQDGASYHFSDFLVFFGKLYVRPYLGTRIAQPHGVNVACIYKGIVVALSIRVVYGGVERVRKTVLEHPC